jgi:hypothetical protein
MIELIEYLELIGYDDANTNFLFIQALIEEDYNVFGMTDEEYSICKKIISKYNL